ncbi:hypothetical protein Salat_2400400 [Sesamum alatum]|uniref:Uncharacterized protein n=1 Tax=Sesamum alatum TaxID=300844 RepID=A0AAE1XXJ9_9LAMI|nr:hypothetical protein Salat_2400400 [Sesamum alatum]
MRGLRRDYQNPMFPTMVRNPRLESRSHGNGKRGVEIFGNFENNYKDNNKGKNIQGGRDEGKKRIEESDKGISIDCALTSSVTMYLPPKQQTYLLNQTLPTLIHRKHWTPSLLTVSPLPQLKTF